MHTGDDRHRTVWRRQDGKDIAPVKPPLRVPTVQPVIKAAARQQQQSHQQALAAVSAPERLRSLCVSRLLLLLALRDGNQKSGQLP